MEICKVDAIPAGQAREFVVGDIRIVIYRRHGSEVFAYLNRCPHLGVPLNWDKDRFMDNDGGFIRCATHGAMFEPESGLCILGPCRGEHLWRLDCSVLESSVHVDESELPGLPTLG